MIKGVLLKCAVQLNCFRYLPGWQAVPLHKSVFVKPSLVNVKLGSEKGTASSSAPLVAGHTKLEQVTM